MTYTLHYITLHYITLHTRHTLHTLHTLHYIKSHIHRLQWGALHAPFVVKHTKVYRLVWRCKLLFTNRFPLDLYQALWPTGGPYGTAWSECPWAEKAVSLDISQALARMARAKLIEKWTHGMSFHDSTHAASRVKATTGREARGQPGRGGPLPEETSGWKTCGPGHLLGRYEQLIEISSAREE